MNIIIQEGLFYDQYSQLIKN